MERIDLLQAYERILHHERAPQRLALRLLAGLAVAALAYAGASWFLLRGAAAVIAERDQAQTDLKALRTRLEDLNQRLSAAQERRDAAAAAFADEERRLAEIEAAARRPGLALARGAAVLAEALPAPAKLVRLEYADGLLRAEGFGLGPAEALDVVKKIRGAGLAAELEGLSTRRRGSKEELFFQVAFRPLAAEAKEAP